MRMPVHPYPYGEAFMNFAIPDLKDGFAGIAVAVSDLDATEPFDSDPSISSAIV
jgi:hypothetical protein